VIRTPTPRPLGWWGTQEYVRRRAHEPEERERELMGNAQSRPEGSRTAFFSPSQLPAP